MFTEIWSLHKAIELCRPANERVIQVLTDVLARAIQEGQLSVRAPGATTRFTFHGVHGLPGDVISAAEHDGTDDEELVASVRELVHRMLDLPSSAREGRADNLGQLAR